ncbi:DUF2314 domain-containing protein [Hydrogenophaga luteola]|uniref:DUF2314 domain-containing protein n=1 Tax=Hydrogenophaga luteola TaxID=1591122 RepID=A0ABV7W9Q0_9BURK
MEEFDGYPVRKGFHGDGWELEDCVAAAKESPKTFKVPSAKEAPLVEIGDNLRLHFVITDPEVKADPENPRAERMWVEVCRLEQDGVFLGHLTNQPVFIESLEPGDVIEFKWNHVAQVYVKKAGKKK